jgi:hypothetical protein
LEKLAGKVFFNHTRRCKKEKAPKLGAFSFPFFRSAGVVPALDSGVRAL